MFTHIVMQLSGRVMALYTQVLEWLTGLLCKLVKHLPASFIQAYRNVVNRRLLVALTESNTSLWRVNLITAVQLIKAGLTTVQAKASQIGSRLLTTVRQISQRVRTVLLQKIDKLVALIKLVQLRLNESKIALIRMVAQLTQAGLKLLDHAKQLLQPAFLLHQLEQVRVALTKWALLIFKRAVAALTLMVNLLKESGLKHLETVRQHLQPALLLQKLNKKLAELIKLVQLVIKKVVAVLTRMVVRLKALGLKLQGTANQPQQRVQRRRSKGH